MKLLLITDQHFGLRSGDVKFLKYYENYYNNLVIPYIKNNNIKYVIDLGDTFDKRKSIDFLSLNTAINVWFEPLHKLKVALYSIVGNHTIFYKNTLKINALQLLVSHYDNIHIIDRPQVILDSIGVVPWICEDNFNNSIDFIKKSSTKLLMGHFEINGFQMYKGGYPVEHGLDASIFKNYDMVYSGHLHHKSKQGNIMYLGNPNEMTWSDYDDPKGFHIFDTETQELEFIENPYRLYYKINYSDIEVVNHNYNLYKDKFVKVYISNSDTDKKYKLFLESLENVNPYKIEIIESVKILSDMTDDEVVDTMEDTMAFINRYITGLDVDNINDLKKLFNELYHKSLEVAV